MSVTAVHGKAASTRRRKCKACGDVFTPTRDTAKYCSTACRSKAYRTRQKPHRRAAAVITTHRACSHCGASFEARSGRGQGRLYCTETCKTLAYRARRSALIDAIAAYTGTSVDIAAESLEVHGMKRATATVHALGMVYNPTSRRWLVPAGAPVRERVRA